MYTLRVTLCARAPCASSVPAQLDPSELWLITQIERQYHERQVKEAAARVLQFTFRHGTVAREKLDNSMKVSMMRRAKKVQLSARRVASGRYIRGASIAQIKRSLHHLKRSAGLVHGARCAR